VSLYDRYLLPYLTHLGMRGKVPAAERAKLVPQASGIVLELGIGSALNLPYYGPAVERLYGVDPSRELWRIGRRRIAAARVPIEFLPVSAEGIPLPDAAVDTVVSTWTLCSVGDPSRALDEVRRVLRPGGRFLFIEHGAAPDPRVRAWQDRLTPWWRRVAGNCHLNREIDRLIAGAGLHVTQLDRSYVRAPRPIAYFYRGVAA
jgi:ubiquinone/menaquinone biosynthesis C-methylase UbiE